MKRRGTNSGFTLIELMLVVAVVGILAAAALPAYQDYTTRARISEAFGLVNVGRHGVAEYYGRWGRMPADNDAAGLMPPDAYRGRAVRSLEVRDGVVRVQVAPFASAAERGRMYTVYVRPAVAVDKLPGTLTWTCNQAVLPGFQVVGTIGTDTPPARFMPGLCR